jgi:hypothetical protein
MPVPTRDAGREEKIATWLAVILAAWFAAIAVPYGLDLVGLVNDGWSTIVRWDVLAAGALTVLLAVGFLLRRH